MLCGSGYFLEAWIRRGPPARVAQGGLVRRPGKYARARYLFICMLCEVEKSTFVQCVLEFMLVLTTGCQNLSEDPVSGSGLCPLSLSWCMHRRCVLIRSDFPATPEPFKKFIFCIKVLNALTLLG
ncbi:hypothetical protein M9H77_17715 [Catharanthus roseus]|uniref:Uncharacterized protein n=1 Tax=Catharanthus roseus TaxID=4058 RepID=A0ACC0B5D7_CATRO|nr:hypothetical protein M9H77_17715 [Catharanthus roseus]